MVKETTGMPNGVVAAVDTNTYNKYLNYYVIFMVLALLIYIIESSTSLQLWRISQRPFAFLPQANEKRMKHLRSRSRLSLIVKLSLLLMLALRSAWRHFLLRSAQDAANSQLEEDMLSRDVDFFASIYLIGNMFCIMIGATTRVIYPGADDNKLKLALERTESYNRIIRTSAYVTAATFVIWAYVKDLEILITAVLHASVLHFFIVNVFQRLLIRECGIIGLATIVIFLGVRTILHPDYIIVSAVPAFEDAARAHIDWLSVLTGGCASATSYVFLASFYRSDFIASRDRSFPEKSPGVDAADLLLPSRILGSEPGRLRMLDPSKRHKMSFRKPYFRAALTGWALSYTILALINMRIGAPPDSNTGVFGLSVACVSPFCMVLFEFVLSLIRGEPERTWRCSVEWDDWRCRDIYLAQIPLDR